MGIILLEPHPNRGISCLHSILTVWESDRLIAQLLMVNRDVVVSYSNKHASFEYSIMTKQLTLSLPRVINFNFLFQSFTRDISYSMENLAFDSLLR